MKWTGRLLALAGFLALMAYGVTRFLEAGEARRLVADAERACQPHGGVQELEILADASGVQVMCADGTRPMRSGDTGSE